MFFKLPQNAVIFWTNHSKRKMRYYGFSEKRVLRILRKPERIEEGIALKTIAAMQGAGTKKNPTEVWMMYQIIKLKIKNPAPSNGARRGQKLKVKIISAWRYPGQTRKGERPIVPEDTLKELDSILN